MYRWIVFLHVLTGFLFMLTHGATATIMYRLRVEREPAALRTLFTLREASELPFNLASGLLVLSGIGLAFLGGWWRAGWIWASLLTFLLITVLMSLFGRTYFDKARNLMEKEALKEPPGPMSEELKHALEAGRPHLLLAVGVGGFAAILYLMMFKPF